MMKLRKELRTLVGVCIAALAFAGSDPEAKASAELRATPNAGFHGIRLGDFEVTALYDGGGPGAFTPEMFHGNQKEIVSLLKKAYVDPKGIVGSDTSFLVNTGEKLILVDAGTGGHWGGPALGKLLSNLRAIGYRPEEVDLVLLTHLHVDHAGGITTLDDQRVFPNAEIRGAKEDGDFWLSEEIAKKAPKEAREFFDAARKVMAPYIAAGKWHPFEGAVELAPGVKALPIHGHTPGHTGYQFTSKGQTLLVWGDVVHLMPVQFPRPEISVVYDVDARAAVKARMPLLRTLAAKGTVIAGAHMPFPGFGRVRKVQTGYSWEPVSYLGTP
jgi:glyoxylase-like metal-dependent hydrolase (beta-lactamase superfamily II)